jgi:hypothetical protein
MKEILTDLIVNNKKKNSTKIICDLILFFYPERYDLVECILKVLERCKKRERELQQQETEGVKKSIHTAEPDKKQIMTEELLRQVASYLNLPKQVKALLATSRSHRDILQPLVNAYTASMEAARQALLERYNEAYDYYVVNNQKGESEEYGYSDMTDWIINEMLSTPYFTVLECLEYINDEDVMNEDLDARVNNMLDFIEVALGQHTLSSWDYRSIFQSFLI